MSDPTNPPPMPEGVIELSRPNSNIVPVNADGTPKPQPPQKIQFKRFPNGMVLAFSQNPRKPGTFAIHDATGTTYALALHPGVADLICQAVTALFAAREAIAKQQIEQLDALSDAAGDAEEPQQTQSKPAAE